MRKTGVEGDDPEVGGLAQRLRAGWATAARPRAETEWRASQALAPTQGDAAPVPGGALRRDWGCASAGPGGGRWGGEAASGRQGKSSLRRRSSPSGQPPIPGAAPTEQHCGPCALGDRYESGGTGTRRQGRLGPGLLLQERAAPGPLAEPRRRKGLGGPPPPRRPRLRLSPGSPHRTARPRAGLGGHRPAGEAGSPGGSCWAAGRDPGPSAHASRPLGPCLRRTPFPRRPGTEIAGRARPSPRCRRGQHVPGRSGASRGKRTFRLRGLHRPRSRAGGGGAGGPDPEQGVRVAGASSRLKPGRFLSRGRPGKGVARASGVRVSAGSGGGLRRDPGRGSWADLLARRRRPARPRIPGQAAPCSSGTQRERSPPCGPGSGGRSGPGPQGAVGAPGSSPMSEPQGWPSCRTRSFFCFSPKRIEITFWLSRP